MYLPLFGAYQAGNAACALAAVEAFAGVAETSVHGAGPTRHPRPRPVVRGLDPDLVRAGFAKASSPGRLEILRRSPTVIADAAHNPAGMAATMEALTESFGFTGWSGSSRSLRTRTWRACSKSWSRCCREIVVTTNSSPRAMPADELAEVAREVSVRTG